MSEEVNRKLPTIRTTLYIDPGGHNAQCYRRTDRQTYDIMLPIADRILCPYADALGNEVRKLQLTVWFKIGHKVSQCHQIFTED